MGPAGCFAQLGSVSYLQFFDARKAARPPEECARQLSAAEQYYKQALGMTLVQTRRFAEARDWAQAALRDYRSCENADQEAVTALKLLEQIESRLQATSPPS